MEHINWQGILVIVVVSLIVGFIAKSIMGGSLNLLWCIVLGFIGNIVGNWLFSLIGKNINIVFGGINFGGIITGVIGACIVLFVAHRLSGK